MIVRIFPHRFKSVRRQDFGIGKAGALGEFNRLLLERPPGRERAIRRSSRDPVRKAI